MADRPTQIGSARDGPDAKSGIFNFLQARKNRKTTRANQYDKQSLDRGRDAVQFHHKSGTSSGPEDTYNCVIRIARSLYRCFLSCKDAFPTPEMKEEWAKDVWNEACARAGAHPNLLRRDGEFECSSMEFLSDIKMKIMPVVESSYEFDTSRAPESISRNATYAQALLTKMTFIYRELNLGGDPHYPCRHPVIQKVINIMWFQNKNDDGIVFHQYFTPIPIEAIGLALTVIECCVDEWSEGTWKESNWSKNRYETIYRSHHNTLHDLRNHGRHPQGGDVLTQIQFDLHKDACTHAGAPPNPIAGSAHQYNKRALDTSGNVAQFQHQSALEEIYSRVIRTARSLYRSFLSCKEAFPTLDMREELAKGVWNEACQREGIHPSLPHQDKKFVYSSMRFIRDIKMKIKHAVQSSYEFDTSQAPDIISRNAIRMQALLTNMTFVYREINFGGDSHHPYRHPIIQKVINITWFQNKDDDGIVFYDYFSPIPIEAIALALTAIECCIYEWSEGTWKASNWSQERYEVIYISHRNSLHDFRNHVRREEGGDLLAQVQFDLLRDARKHAGAPPDPITGKGRLPLWALEAAAEEDPPAYDQSPGIPETRVSDA